MGVPLPAGKGIRGGMDLRGIPGLLLGKGKGRLELGVGDERCGHWEENGDRRRRTFRPRNVSEAENPKAKRKGDTS